MTAAEKKADAKAAVDEEIRVQLESCYRVYGRRNVDRVSKAIPKEKQRRGKRATFEQKSDDYDDLRRAQRILVIDGKADSVWEAFAMTAPPGSNDEQRHSHADRLWKRLDEDGFRDNSGLFEICHLRQSHDLKRALSQLKRIVPATIEQSERAQLAMILAYLTKRADAIEITEVRAELMALWDIVRRVPGWHMAIEEFGAQWSSGNPTI